MHRSSHHNAHALRDPQLSLHQVAPASLQELSSPLIGPDDVPVEIEDLGAHFLMDAMQSSIPSAPAANDTSDPLFELDAPLEAALSELYFDELDAPAAQRSFERMWNEILRREQPRL